MPRRKSVSGESERLLQLFAENIAGSHHIYVPIVRKFLRYCGPNLTRKAVERYIAKMREEEYSDGRIDLEWRTLRRFFKIAGVEWPFRRHEGPKIREREVFAPALDPEIIRQMIKAATTGILNAEESAMLALSTIYGLRRVEMASIVSGGGDTLSDINLKSRVLFIQTAKHGRQRYHLIPEEIVPYLAAYRFPKKPRPAQELTDLFYSIERKLGLDHIPEVGWHAIRRTLVQVLIEAGLPELTVMSFLRWKRTERSMVALYYATTRVGLGGVRGRTLEVQMKESDRRIDEAVFEVHPFLPEWRSS